MNNIIELTKENISNIKYQDIVAITIAEGGAMGEPDGFYAVLNNYSVYHTNFRNTQIAKEKFFAVFPLLKTFNCSCGHVINLNDEWKWFYMGVGNYLIVREQYYDVVMNCIKENLPEDYQRGYLYQKWYDIITKVVK